MKKKFVKVALLSVLTCGLPATFTSCDDDGWKDRTNVLDEEMAEKGELIDKLSDQINTLNTQIAQYKAEGEAAQKAADAAMAAAKDAKKAGDDAMAAAKTADAAAQLAAQSAAEAKEEAAKALKANYEELKALIDANAKEIAANKALIEGNKALIEQYKGLIDGNTVKINDNAGAIAKILESLNSYATNDQLADVVKDLNEKLEAAGVKSDNAIAELNGTVAGINAAITALNGQAEALGLDITNLKKATDEQLGTLEANLLAKVEAEAALRAEGDKALQDQIDALKKELSNLEIASNLEQFTKFIAETNTQLAALKSYDEKLTNDLSALAGQVSAAEDLIKENQGKIATLTKDLKAAADKAAANAKAISDQAVLVKKNADNIATLDKSVEELKAALKTLNTETIAGLNGHLKTIDGQIEGINTSIEGLTNRLNSLTPYIITMTMDQLRGLVFIPNTFVGGIESALSYNMVYQPMSSVATSPDKINFNINDVAYQVTGYKALNLFVKQNEKEVAVHPATEVSYHMNPTSAKVDFNDLKIVSNDAEIISRASSSDKIALDGSYNDNKGLSIADGVLTVAINGEAPFFNDASKKMPVFALQAKVYSEKERDAEPEVITVTSDYAMFVRMDVRPDAISIYPEGYVNAVAAEFRREDNKYVYGSVQEALQNVATVKVAWDGSVDLSKIFQIDYTDINRGQTGSWTSEEEWGKFGLKFNYTLVNYYAGDNKSSESDWATLDENGVLTPCLAGKPGEQSRDALGKMPLVFVTVTNGNNIVLRGFVKALIVPTEGYYETKDVVYSAIDFTCDPVVNSFENAELSGDVAQNMLDATGLTQNVFARHYFPDGDRETGALYQFTRDGDAFAPRKTDIGEIIYNGVAADGLVQNFMWNLDVEDKQMIYEGKNHTETVYVCFTSDNLDVFPALYIPLTRTVNAKPVAKVEAKMQARWFRGGTTALLNIQQPTNGEQPTTIATNLNLLWQKGTPVFEQISGQPKINPDTYKTQNGLAGGYRYYFPDVQKKDIDGIKFTVGHVDANGNIQSPHTTNPCLIGDGKFSNDKMGDHALMVVKNGKFVADGEYNNNAILANGKLLATLDQAEGVVTLAETPEAQALLNKYSSDGDGLDRTNAKLQVQVGVVAYNECGIALELKENSIIPATFLRPINIDGLDEVKPFEDATANGSSVDVYSLLTFSDWRGVSFASNEWLFGYYNVKSVTVHKDRIKSNAGTIDDKNPVFTIDQTINDAFSIVNQAGITYDKADINSAHNTSIKNTVSKNFGKIVYDNTKLNIKEFQVQIPMTIEYGLGEFEVTVTCNVKATM